MQCPCLCAFLFFLSSCKTWNWRDRNVLGNSYICTIILECYVQVLIWQNNLSSLREKYYTDVTQRNAPKLYFPLALASSKSPYRRLFASKFFPGFLQRSSYYRLNRGASGWKHPQHVKQQNEGNCRLACMVDILAQSACLSLGVYAPKRKVFACPVKVILTPVMLIIGKCVNCLQKTPALIMHEYWSVWKSIWLTHSQNVVLFAEFQ